MQAVRHDVLPVSSLESDEYTLYSGPSVKSEMTRRAMSEI